MVGKSSTGTSTAVKPKQWALIIHLRKTFSLIGAVLSDPRVHWIRKTLFLGTIALVVAIAAFPVVRGLTRRLERLQTGVETLGAGQLSARVRVEGRDEVARLVAEQQDVRATLEKSVADEEAYGEEKRRTEAEKKASQDRVTAMRKSKADIDGSVLEGTDLRGRALVGAFFERGD